MNRPPVVVFKIGGSLLDLPDLGTRVARLLALREAAHPLLICGGGRLADVVRDWHDIHRLTEAESHRLAMQTLSVSARLLAGLVPHGCVCAGRDELHHAWKTGGIPVVDPAGWMARHPHWFDAANQQRLEESWSVTSDTLAAAIAIDFEAQELVLAKSVGTGCEHDLASLARSGVVDAAFPPLARRLSSLGVVNLRRATLAIDRIPLA